jgi:hypothetical protein
MGQMAVCPRSLVEFHRRFPTDEACGEYLVAVRWSRGFCCPACGHDRGWRLKRRLPAFEYAGCDRQTSVTAGTVMHRSHLPLTTWFWAAYLMATHSNGISALQLQGQFGIGSYKTTWPLARKLRRATADSERLPLAGLVEIDETSLPQRTKDDPPGGDHGRSGKGKMPVVAAVEIEGRKPRRLRLPAVADYSARSLHAFIARAVAPDAILRSDAWKGYPGAPVADHDPRTVGPHGSPPRPALDSPRLQQPQALGLGHLSRPPTRAPPGLPRRVHLRLPPPARPRHRPPARQLPDADQP